MQLSKAIAERFPEDRVRRHTPPEINQRVDDDFRQRVRAYSGADRETLTRRINALDREWDMERTLEANAATLSLVGSILGAAVNKRLIALPIIVTGFLLQHAVQGWCPPVPVFRRLGVRTRQEIERERYALKLLRGDFETVGDGRSVHPDRLIQAVES